MRADRAALSQAGQRAASQGTGEDAADLLFAAVVQPGGPGGGRGIVRFGDVAPVCGIDLGAEPVPDETTVCKFRHLLEEHNLGEQILGTVNLHLEAKGVRITTGTIVDATLIHAPSSTKNRDQSRDPEMHQAKKGKNWYFGMKAHVGVDSELLMLRASGTFVATHSATPTVRGWIQRAHPWDCNSG